MIGEGSCWGRPVATSSPSRFSTLRHRPRRNKSAWLAQEAKGGEWKAACNNVIRQDLATEWRGYRCSYSFGARIER
jgi:hypothetical protein